MQPDFWLERWKTRDTGWHQSEVNPYLRAHWGRLMPARASRVFVPLCGKSRDLSWLREQGHEVVGVELSPHAAEEFYAEQGLRPQVEAVGTFERWTAGGITILRGDFFDLSPALLDGVAGVFDRAALIAFEPEARPAYVRHLAAVLPARAAMLLVTMEFPGDATVGPPFSVTENEIEGLYGRRFTVARLETRDIIDSSPRFRARGLTTLAEKVFLLEPKTAP